MCVNNNIFFYFFNKNTYVRVWLANMEGMNLRIVHSIYRISKFCVRKNKSSILSQSPKPNFSWKQKEEKKKHFQYFLLIYLVYLIVDEKMLPTNNQ